MSSLDRPGLGPEPAKQSMLSQVSSLFAGQVNQIVSPRSMLVSMLRPQGSKGGVLACSDDTTVWVPPAASNGSVLTSDTSQTGGVKWVPHCGGRMYLSSNFVVSNGGGQRQIGAGSSLWTETYDTTPSSDLVNVGTNPRFVIPSGLGGYWELILNAYWAVPGVALSISASICKNAVADANRIMAQHGQQPASPVYGTGLMLSDVQSLSAGDILYPCVQWNYGGAATNHTVQAGPFLTYMTARFLGPV